MNRNKETIAFVRYYPRNPRLLAYKERLLYEDDENLHPVYVSVFEDERTISETAELLNLKQSKVEHLVNMICMCIRAMYFDG
jgi:DNA-directed RNA polymerase specialized sigma subunit